MDARSLLLARPSARFDFTRGLAACLLALSACDFTAQTPDELAITVPADGTEITDDNDVDKHIQGTQIAVTVAGQNNGHQIRLDRVVGKSVKPLTSSQPLVNGVAIFPKVTLLPGDNILMAEDLRTGRSSTPVTITLDSPCIVPSLIEPIVPTGASEKVLGPMDDNDGTPCGDSFSIRFVAGADLPHGAQTKVLARPFGKTSDTYDVELGLASSQHGTLVIDPLPLDPIKDAVMMGPFQFVLQGDGASCANQPFGPSIRIDCEGPETCNVAKLHDGDVVTSNDESDAGVLVPGMQLTIAVDTSDDDARGQPVKLIINDGLVTRESTAATEGPPTAVFEEVPLPEGDVRIDPICEDSVHNQTMGQRRTIVVDSLPCPVSITSPALDTMFMPTGSATTVDVPVSASFSGGDCSFAYASVGDEKCTGLFTTSAMKLAVGQTTVPATLTLDTPGPNILCVGIEDMHGNTSYATVRVLFTTPSMHPQPKHGGL